MRTREATGTLTVHLSRSGGTGIVLLAFRKPQSSLNFVSLSQPNSHRLATHPGTPNPVLAGRWIFAPNHWTDVRVTRGRTHLGITATALPNASVLQARSPEPSSASGKGPRMYSDDKNPILWQNSSKPSLAVRGSAILTLRINLC